MSKISTQSYTKAARREPRITNQGVLAANLPNSAASTHAPKNIEWEKVIG